MSRVPNRSEKEDLQLCGLGEKQIQINISASSSELRMQIQSLFPRLKDIGGFEYLRCLPNSRALVVLQTIGGGHTPMSLKATLGNAKLYVRPIQQDIEMQTECRMPNNQSCQAEVSSLF